MGTAFLSSLRRLSSFGENYFLTTNIYVGKHLKYNTFIVRGLIAIVDGVLLDTYSNM